MTNSIGYFFFLPLTINKSYKGIKQAKHRVWRCKKIDKSRLWTNDGKWESIGDNIKKICKIWFKWTKLLLYWSPCPPNKGTPKRGGGGRYAGFPLLYGFLILPSPNNIPISTCFIKGVINILFNVLESSLNPILEPKLLP